MLVATGSVLLSAWVATTSLWTIEGEVHALHSEMSGGAQASWWGRQAQSFKAFAGRKTGCWGTLRQLTAGAPPSCLKRLGRNLIQQIMLTDEPYTKAAEEAFTEAVAAEEPERENLKLDRQQRRGKASPKKCAGKRSAYDSLLPSLRSAKMNLDRLRPRSKAPFNKMICPLTFPEAASKLEAAGYDLDSMDREQRECAKAFLLELTNTKPQKKPKLSTQANM
ncbi:hypothetical protein D9Q98_001423 [Chlorella vulgaris]|uniref:Uncharacterized protein n=1 Tax=Chlorella vulgaris TaxID=3077 RepID=A0A9D4TZV9_CHLVU|nr:hypothetical protein D9Q98_001423 [Chlorella vulgaris]